MRRLKLLLVGALLMASGACVPGFGGDTMTVTAYFQDTAGLFEGNDVGVLGVKVGRITSIEPQGTQVKVTLEVDKDQPIPADVHAVVVARSVATDRYVELTPVYESGPKMDDDATIPEDRTQTPVEFDEVLAALNTFATGIAGDKKSADAIARIINSGSAGLAGKGKLFNDTVGDLADAVGSFNSQSGDFTGTVDSLDKLVGSIAANQQTTNEFIDQVTQVSTLLNDERDNFRTALRKLNKAITAVAAYTTKHRDDIVKVLGNSTKVFTTLLSRQNDLAKILERLPLVLENLERAGRGKTVPVRVPANTLLGVGNVLAKLCPKVLSPLCSLITTSAAQGGNR